MNRFVLGFCLLFVAFFNVVSAKVKPVELVDPQMGSAWSRWFYFSSASRPFGMVSLFPDTKIDGEWKSGYRYGLDTIRDFSHVHEWQLSGVAVMPVVYDESDLSAVFLDWSSPFSHEKEKVEPGYHAVYLERSGVQVELTATNRVGMHRYVYPESKPRAVLFQLSGQLGPSNLQEGGFKQISETELTGYVVNAPTMRRPKATSVFFSVRFSHPIRSILLSTPEGIRRCDAWHGANGNILVEFEPSSKLPLLMKVGLSYTNEEGATSNMHLEMPNWDFDQAKQEASNHWNSLLSRIEIKGGTLVKRQRFYTDLFHALMGRRMVSDVDGRYSDMTGPRQQIRQIPRAPDGKPSFNMYNSDAFWGAQWTLNTLWQLVYPEIAEDFCQSFLEYYRNGGLIPRGPSGGNYTFVMNGASSTPFFVSAWQKGLRNFDVHLAYEGLKKNHLPGGMMSKVGYEHNTSIGGGLDQYIQNGYVPYPLSDTVYGSHQDGAAITLENAYQDWCLAQLALTLGKVKDAEQFLKRSQNYKNLFNPQWGYIVPKDRYGNWKSPYDPLLYDNGFIEGNGAQYSWFVPHDLAGLFQLRGGSDSVISRLNREFEETRPHRFCNEHPDKEALTGQKYVQDKRTWINYSNQPGSNAVFLFNHAGAPWLTQKWSRAVVDSVFSGFTPFSGYQGDEDQGLMGSLSVLMKMGIFQMTGGCEADPVYELGSPIFDQIVIHLNPTYYHVNKMEIRTYGNANDHPYIQAARLNGTPIKRFWFTHSEIQNGLRLEFKMGPKPNPTVLDNESH